MNLFVHFLKGKTMADKLHPRWFDQTQNYLICKLKLVVWTFNLMNQPIEIQEKSPKLLSKQIRKRYYKTVGARVIKSLLLSPFLDKNGIETSKQICYK